MSETELGLPFDIHGGGVDLIFPHHENEIAQSEAATGVDMARYWLHGGMLQTGGEKMSKSLGNFLLLHDLLKHYEVPVIRLLMLQTHYRSPIEFSDERLHDAQTTLERIQEFIDRSTWVLQTVDVGRGKRNQVQIALPSEGATALQSAFARARGTFTAEMDDDFNTAGALASLFELIRQGNSFLDAHAETTLNEDESIALKQAVETLLELLEVLGVSLTPKVDKGDDEAEALLAERSAARAAKDWARADAIRNQLDTLGYEIKDTPQGPRLVKHS